MQKGKYKDEIANYWREMDYIDRWSYVHFLTGVNFGFIPIFFNISLNLSFVIFLFLTIIWEFLEIFGGIRESKKNSIIDIFTSSIGFYLINFIILILNVNNYYAGVLLTISLISVLILSFKGWMSYKKRF